MEKRKTCGIVMPIAECDGQDQTHWIDVKSIIMAAAETLNYDVRLVSETIESNLIHKEILQNIYQDDIIICDVSGRNPNVFFELGIRMATQKPTIIVKDNKTAYPFDTGPNRYIEYPRDLRHPEMEKFKNELIQALQSTVSQKPENSFIGQLGPFKVPDVESSKIPASEVILDKLERIEKRISYIDHQTQLNTRQKTNAATNRSVRILSSSDNIVDALISGYSPTEVSNGISQLTHTPRYDDLDSGVLNGKGREVRVQILGKNVENSSFSSDLLRAIQDTIQH